jgi:hypothetical protein
MQCCTRHTSFAQIRQALIQVREVGAQQSTNHTQQQHRQKLENVKVLLQQMTNSTQDSGQQGGGVLL